MTNEKLDNQLSKLRIEKDRKRARRSRIPWIWLIVLALAVGLGFCVYGKMNAPLPVKVVRVEQDEPQSGKGPALVTASGYVVPRHKVEVSSKIVGRVRESLVKRGDRVKQGDVLLRIEDDDYQARVRSAEAEVAALRARVAELRAGSRPQEIEAARAAVASSEATLRNAEADFRRIEALYAKGAISSQEVDRARTARDVAQARLDSDRKTAELVKIGPRKEIVDAAEAQLRSAEANLELAKTELGYTVIAAPISGVILEKLAEQGELVTNTNFGGTRGAKSSVVSMADLADLQVEVDVNETELSKIKLHQPVEIRLDSMPDRAYSGEVDEISPQADRQKGTVQVKVRIADPDESIKTEVNARVTFLGDAPQAKVEASGQPRLWIPKSAIAQGTNGPIVYVLAGDKAVATSVSLGIEAEKGVEITKGLSGSEKLISAPVEKLTDGCRVTAAL